MTEKEIADLQIEILIEAMNEQIEALKAETCGCCHPFTRKRIIAIWEMLNADDNA